MIHLGIKASLFDWKERIQVDPDFIELISSNLTLKDDLAVFRGVVFSKQIPVFVHLPTTFKHKDDIFMLNLASKQDWIRRLSRETLLAHVSFSHSLSPKAFIVHTPTQNDFSSRQGIIETQCEQNFYSEAVNWLSELPYDFYIENIPPAIVWDEKVFERLPYTNNSALPPNLHQLIDTGHLFAELRDAELTYKHIEQNINTISYLHISTITTPAPYDSHGQIFCAQRKEFPNVERLVDIILTTARNRKSSADLLRLICEPGGGSQMHTANYRSLKESLGSAKISHFS